MNAERAANTLEAGRVVRYHAVPTVQPQNVGHHSWGVAIIALFITGGNASKELLTECLMHDSAELFTGDVPFTVKRDNADVKKRFDAMEDTVRLNELLLPPADLSSHDAAVLKLADTLEGFIWCRKTEIHGPVKDRWVAAFGRAIDKFAPVLGSQELHNATLLFETFS